MTTTNFKTNNKDLGEIFYARTNVDPQINFNTNYIIHNTNQNTNIDLKELFYPYIHGNKAQLTNFKTNNTDLNELFQNINIPPILQYTISDQTKYTVVTNNNNTQFTFVFADYILPLTTNPEIGTSSTSNSITFEQEVTATITIISGGGGGGSNDLAKSDGGGAGQGGETHTSQYTINENQPINIVTGASGIGGIGGADYNGKNGGSSIVTISQATYAVLGGVGGIGSDSGGGSGGSGSGNGGYGGYGGTSSVSDGENGGIGQSVNSIFDNSIVWYFGGGGGGGSSYHQQGSSKGGQGGGGGAGQGQEGNDNLEYNGPNGIYYPKDPSIGKNYKSGYPGTGGGGAGGNGDWNQNLNPGGNGGSGIIIIQISL